MIYGIPASVCVSAAVLFLLTVMLLKARLNYLSLPQLPVANHTQDANRVTVVIPARNEAHCIAQCVKGFPAARVIVVDDDSSDATGLRARQAGAEVILAPPVPHGYKGKPNALIAGAALATTDYLLFADADTSFDPAFLSSAICFAETHHTVLLSAFLRQRCLSVFEKMLIPYAFALYFTGVNSKSINSMESKDALANGQCMLFERVSYETAGGHRAVHKSVIEDVELARLLKQHHRKVLITRAEHLGSVRMYDSLPAIWRGFRKNSFRFLRLDAALALQVVLSTLLLLNIGPLALWLARDQQWAWLAGLLFWPVLILRPWYGGWLGPFLYLPAVYLFQGIALHAMFSQLFGWETQWKDRPV